MRIVNHEIVLECIFLTITLKKNRVSHCYFLPNSSYSSQIQSANEKTKHLTRFYLRMNVNMTAVKHHFLSRNTISDNSLDIFSIKISYM